MIDTKTNALNIRRTKIIATLVPASSEPEQIRNLINAGVNIFRQNFSHGEHSYHKETYAEIRKISKELMFISLYLLILFYCLLNYLNIFQNLPMPLCLYLIF